MPETQQASKKKALSVKEAAGLLNQTERAIWMKIYRHQIPYRRWGKRVFILTEELEEFLKALDGVSADEAAERAAAVLKR